MSTGTFSATPSTAATLSDASPQPHLSLTPSHPPPCLQPVPPSTPGHHSFHLIVREKITYIYLFEDTEDLGISSKVSTLKTATTEIQKAKESPP